MVCGMIKVPEKFARLATELNGPLGTAWVESLPEIVSDLMGRWDCAPDGQVMHGGVGLIVPVRYHGCHSGSGNCPAVLKVSPPHPGNVHEPDAFAAWQGHGAVRMHERDDAQFAILLERVSTETLASLGSPEEIARVLGQVSRRLAIPAPPHLPRLRDRAGEWEYQLRADDARLEHSMSRRTVDAAIATVRELGAAQPDILIHGDLHGGNILRADREPWLAVDPKGYVGDPAYDGGNAMKTTMLRVVGADDPYKAVLRLFDVFAEAAEVDVERVRRWTQFYAVDAAFWARRQGFSGVRGGEELEHMVSLCELAAEVLV
jgi:streptomycin 6-kinase